VTRSFVATTILFVFSTALSGCTWVALAPDADGAEELTTLARNDAPELGGNTVVAEGPVSNEGVQRFAIYNCPVVSD